MILRQRHERPVPARTTTTKLPYVMTLIARATAVAPNPTSIRTIRCAAIMRSVLSEADPVPPPE